MRSTTMIGLFNHLRKSAVLTIGLATGVAGFAAPATAGDDNNGRYGDRFGRDYHYGVERRYDRDDFRRDWDRDRNRDRHDQDRKDRDRDRDTDIKIDIDFNTGRTTLKRETEFGPRFGERRVRYWVEPQYKVVSERVWVEPVYRDVTERVWVEPVYRTEYTEVYAPARYEVREVVSYSRGRKVVTRERTLIEPACTKRIPREVCVAPGRWETVTRQVCVTPGRWDVVEKRVCVSEGRWDYRVERVEYSGRREETLLDVRF